MDVPLLILNNKNNISYGKNKEMFWRQMRAGEKNQTILNTEGVQS